MPNLLIITQKADKDDQLLGFFVSWIQEFKKFFSRVTVTALRAPEKSWLRLGLQILWQVPRHDAVFVHMAPMFAILAGPWARLWGKRIGLWYTHGTVTWKLRLAEKLVHVIFTASPESFRLTSSKVIVTGHGIDTEHFSPSTKSEARNPKLLKILSVGRIAPVKNYESLIDALALLHRRNISVHLTMVGEPAVAQDFAYREKLKNLAQQRGVENNITWAGKIGYDHMPVQYQAHDVFVHLSRTGSLDKVILEAMACGISVVSSNDASRSFLPSELIIPHNDPAILAQKLVSCKDQPLDSKLRQYVVAHHGLGNLIALLSKNL